MIYDSFANFDRYKSIAPEVWDKVKSFIIKATQTAAAGKFPIFQENCFASIAEYKTKEFNPDLLEIHDEYLDIQIALKGTELIFCRDCTDLDEIVPYSTEKDIAFYRMEADNVTELLIQGTKFAVFFPGEGHLPGCDPAPEEAVDVLKLIVKIHRSYLK